jgi:hypothetical protein
MGSITALLLVTPIFGFSLQAPAFDQASDLSAKAVAVQESSAKRAQASSDERGEEAESGQAEYMLQIKERNRVAGLHRVFGVSTWAAMTLTVAAGFIDYYNQYGFGAGIGDNPCVEGNAIFGDSFGCHGIRTVKSVAAYVTTGLYATTFTLSLLMPDPDDLASGKGDFASTLRLHKTLRWVHFSGMLLQIALGIAIAGTAGSLDRANDYGTLQALATVHLVSGLVTYGALTWAGALMTF